MKENIFLSNPNWKNWEWQQRFSIKDIRKLKDFFRNVNPDFFDELYIQSGERIKFQVTPYILSQIPRDLPKKELIKNPWFLQFFPLGKMYLEGHDAYDGTDNWENPKEFPTRNIHHKYTNRVLIRFRNCLGYCNFCFEALGTLEKCPSPEKQFSFRNWKESLEYIRKNPKIEEVIFSGGEPLLNPDSKLENILKDLSNIKRENKQKIKFKRIHTRALTINPFRVTPNLIDIFGNYRINEIAFDVAHPSEFTPEFENVVEGIKERTGKYSPLLVLHTPLIRGVNDNTDILWDLFSKAYEMNIKPYYLLHSMPHTPFADQQRISVRDGIRLLKPLWREKSHIALPEYVIVHYEGKRTIPLEIGGTPEFQYIKDESGNPFIRFKNWKGNWVEYPDAKDTIIQNSK